MRRKNHLRLCAFMIFGASAFLALGFTLGRNTGEITPATIDSAAELIGLTFSTSEKDSMLNALNTQRDNFEILRQTKLDNSVAPALIFNPLPQGFFPDQAQETLDWGLDETVTLPAEEKDIAYLTVYQLAVLIKNKQISSERLTQIYLNRIKTYSDTLQSLITLLEKPALAKAQAMDAELAAGKYRGPLHGIPYGIKDLLAVKGTKTTWGANPYKDQVVDETATVVEKLEEAGGVLVGKFTLGALAMGDVWYGGVTKNPWNLKQGSSGSSAGSASAVSAGLVPFAIGTETLGSIVSPSTRNGVTGLRPTYGRVSKHGAMALSWSMDKIGPISRSALDNAIVLSVINGMDEKDASSIPAAFNYSVENEVKELKVGYFKSFFEGDRPNIKNDQAVLEVLKNQGFELHPLELKPSINPAPIANMLLVEGAAAFDELTRLDLDDQLVAQHRNAWPNIFRSARFIPAVEYVQMSRQRTLLIQEMHALMKDYDVIVTPSFAGQQLQITNLTGHPALCLPNGFGENGSPTSITLLANLFEEEKLIMLGRLIQENTDWQSKRPPMFDR
ncbi:amidase [Algoriphagus jejuensis]